MHQSREPPAPLGDTAVSHGLCARTTHRFHVGGGTMKNAMSLSEQDMYVLSRVMAGLNIDGLPLSTGVSLLLDTLDLNKPGDYQQLQRVLREANLLSTVLGKDPHSPPPSADSGEQICVPSLPREAQLTDAALRASGGVGGWLDEFTAWAACRAPMTPPSFITAGGVWTLSLAIARRCSLHLHAPIFPHLYILWIAPTSIFRKTTALDTVADLVKAAMPHMLLPEENTPEAFITTLAGRKPPNYEELRPCDKLMDDLGRAFAAQQGILIDEASSLLGAARKDYMQGFVETVLRLYDAADSYTRNVRGEGRVTIRDGSLCLLGATTPQALLRVGGGAWATGEYARYGMLYPERIMPFDLGSADPRTYPPPAALVSRLGRLHSALPMPPQDEDTRPAPLHALFDADAFTAYAAYAKAVTYDMLKEKGVEDTRIHPNYARMHIQAVKIALSLAAVDWADEGANGAIRVTLGHWARGQTIAETWRSSLHHLLAAIDRGDEVGHQDKLLAVLERAEAGLSVRELSRSTHLTYKEIEATLRVLREGGMVEETLRKNPNGGREAVVFRASR
jgi:DNA-binding transcriptional ArsR family regulator